MRVKLRARRKVRSALEMTPFMDLAVQLVIFFMLTSTFATSEAIAVDLPSASTASVLKENEEIVVTVDRQDALFVDGKRQSFAELADLFRAAAGAGRRPEVRIGADRLSSHGTVVRVMDEARKSGLSRFAIAAAPGEPAAIAPASPAAPANAPAPPRRAPAKGKGAAKEGRS